MKARHTGAATGLASGCRPCAACGRRSGCHTESSCRNQLWHLASIEESERWNWTMFVFSCLSTNQSFNYRNLRVAFGKTAQGQCAEGAFTGIWAGRGPTHSLRWWVCLGVRDEFQSPKQQGSMTLRKTLSLSLCTWRPRLQGITIASCVLSHFASSYSHGWTASLPFSLQNHLIIPVVLPSFKATLRTSSPHSQQRPPESCPLTLLAAALGCLATTVSY